MVIDPYDMWQAPVHRPAQYPGYWPTSSCIVTSNNVMELTGTGADFGSYIHEGATVDSIARSLGHPPCADRIPVVSVGSNAAPSQLRFKFLGEPSKLFTPMFLAQVPVSVVYAAHRTPYGSVPSTPYVEPDTEISYTELFVQLMTAEQLERIDDTEFPAYKRVELPGPALIDGDQVAVQAYVTTGNVISENGRALIMPTPGGIDNSRAQMRAIAAFKTGETVPNLLTRLEPVR